MATHLEKELPVDPTSFISALLAIIVIDLVLAGDNAIVIALAARGLPGHLQKRAILWGAVGAIGVRTLMTVAVVWLLKIPGLLLAGGAMLVWIGYRLLRPDVGDGEADHPTATTFWSAMRTIVVADAVMGLDNVLAVAGAAHGSYLLVVAGLVISVPIVVWGSTLVLKVVDRYPGVVYLGSAVLVWTAVKMMMSEAFLQPWFESAPLVRTLAYLLIPLVLFIAFAKNHKRFESRIHARLAEFAKLRPIGASSDPSPSTFDDSTQGDFNMLKILVPVDGSDNALRAVRHVVAEYQRHHELEVHILNVQPRLSNYVARFVSRSDRASWHQNQAQLALNGARDLLHRSNVPHQVHWVSGDRGDEIVRAAERMKVHHIVMGTARKNSLTRMLEDSVTDKVLRTTGVPVEVVAGNSVSRWESWGIPAAAASAAGLMMLAID